MLNNIKKKGIILRFVELSDAAFIVNIRSSSKNQRFISKTSNSVEEQKKWIERYKLREAKNKEFYYVFMDDKNNRWGTYRLYNIGEDSFTIGSWVAHPDTPKKLAIKADLIMKKIGFTMLNKPICNFDVRKLNKTVVRYHLMFEPTKIAEDELNYFYKIDYKSYLMGKEKISQMLNIIL